MKKYLPIVAILILLAIGGFFVWQRSTSASKADDAPAVADAYAVYVNKVWHFQASIPLAWRAQQGTDKAQLLLSSPDYAQKQNGDYEGGTKAGAAILFRGGPVSPDFADSDKFVSYVVSQYPAGDAKKVMLGDQLAALVTVHTDNGVSPDSQVYEKVSYEQVEFVYGDGQYQIEYLAAPNQGRTDWETFLATFEFLQ